MGNTIFNEIGYGLGLSSDINDLADDPYTEGVAFLDGPYHMRFGWQGRQLFLENRLETTTVTLYEEGNMDPIETFTDADTVVAYLNDLKISTYNEIFIEIGYSLALLKDIRDINAFAGDPYTEGVAFLDGPEHMRFGWQGRQLFLENRMGTTITTLYEEGNMDPVETFKDIGSVNAYLYSLRGECS
jgi:hypothetical protein